jgi:hypothetical protein
MMDKNSFDNHVREQFSGYSPEVPSHIWENISRKKDKRRPGALFFLRGGTVILIAALIAAAGTIYYFNSSSNPDIQNADQASSNNLSKSTDKNDKAPAVFNDIANAQTIIPGTSTNNAAPISMSAKPSGDILMPAGILPGKHSTKQTTGSINVQIISPAQDESLEEEYTLTVLPSEFEKPSSRIPKPALRKINMPALPIPCPTAEDNAAGNKRYFEVYGSADKAFRSFSDTGNSSYLQTRKQTTSEVLSFSAGIRYTRVFNNGMSVRAGLNYSQINEKFTYNNGHVVQMVYILNSNGDTTGSYIQSGTRYKSSINKYRTLDIPLLIGYELGNGRLHTNINAGPVVNLYSWQKGSLLDTAGNIIDITSGKGESPYHFKKNIGIGFMGAVSVYYKLNDRIHILAEPYFRYNFSQVNKPEMTFRQKYNTAGLKLGLRVDF